MSGGSATVGVTLLHSNSFDSDEYLYFTVCPTRTVKKYLSPLLSARTLWCGPVFPFALHSCSLTYCSSHLTLRSNSSSQFPACYILCAPSLHTSSFPLQKPLYVAPSVPELSPGISSSAFQPDPCPCAVLQPFVLDS